MQIEWEGDLAEFRLYADLVAAVPFKGFKLGNFEILNLRHNPLGLRQSIYNNRFVTVFATCNHKLILQVIILDGVEDLQAGEILVLPKISNLVKRGQECKGCGDPVQDRLLKVFGETVLNPKIQYEIISGIGDDDVGYPGILTPGNARNQQEQAECEYRNLFLHTILQ